VFLLIFSYFKVPDKYLHKILFYGIIGAIVMRAFFIFVGIKLVIALSWVVYLFGAFLIIPGLKLARGQRKTHNPEDTCVLRLFKRFFPVTDRRLRQRV